MFKEYKDHHTDSPFVEETLKDHLRETLKEIKIGTSIDDNSNKTTLQCDEVLEQLKCTDGHGIEILMHILGYMHHNKVDV